MAGLSGAELAEHRHARGLSQKAFAEILGVSERALSGWEHSDAVPLARVPLILRRLSEWDASRRPPAALAAYSDVELLAELLARRARGGAGEAGGESLMPGEPPDGGDDR